MDDIALIGTETKVPSYAGTESVCPPNLVSQERESYVRPSSNFVIGFWSYRLRARDGAIGSVM